MTKDLCIQIHPNRSPDLDLAHILAQCESLSHDTALVRRLQVSEGEDNGRYVNVMFETPNPRALWDMLQSQIYQGGAGEPMRRSSMASCQGADGWDDYLLLHHYDPAQALDRFDGD